MRETTRTILRTVYRSCRRLLRSVEKTPELSTVYLSERCRPTDWGGHRSVADLDRAARLVSTLAELRKDQGALPGALAKERPKDKFAGVGKPASPRQRPVFPDFLAEISQLVREPGSGVPAAAALRALSAGYREGWNGSIGSCPVGAEPPPPSAPSPLDDAEAVRAAFGALRVVGRLVGLQSVSSQATTKGIKVLVSPEELMRRTFAYKVRIINTSEDTVQLVSRHWIIEDGQVSSLSLSIFTRENETHETLLARTRRCASPRAHWTGVRAWKSRVALQGSWERCLGSSLEQSSSIPRARRLRLPEQGWEVLSSLSVAVGRTRKTSSR